MKACVKNILESSMVSLWTGTEDSSYPLYRLHDRNIGRTFRPTAAETVEILVENGNLIENSFFETGDFTGWTQANSVIAGTPRHSGAYSAKVEAAGETFLAGALQGVDVDPTRTYKARAWAKVDSFVEGIYKVRVRFLDQGDALLGDHVLGFLTADSAWTLFEGTMGPPGAGADVDFPPGTAKVDVQHYWQHGGGCTGSGYLDDVFFCRLDDLMAVDRLVIPAGHGLAGMALAIKYTDDWTAWSDAVTPWTQPSSGLIEKSWDPAVTANYWKFVITSPSAIPSIAELFLTSTYEWERNPARPTGALDDEFNVENALTSGGQDRFLVHGEPKRQRVYHMPRCGTAQRDNVLALNEAWAGSRPFWLCDHEGRWIYGKLRAPLDLREVAHGAYSFDFEFLEVLP